MTKRTVTRPDKHKPALQTIEHANIRGHEITVADCTCGDRDHHWIDVGPDGRNHDWREVVAR